MNHILSHGGVLGRAGLLLLGLLSAVGCNSVPADAKRQIEQAHQAMESGRFDDTERLVSPVIAAHPDTPEAAEALYLRGLARLKSGKRQPARFDFEAAVDRTTRKDLMALLHAQLGNMDYDDAAYVRAAEHYRLARADLPPRATTADVLLRYGISLQRTGRMDEARQVLTDLAERYGDTRAAADARRKLDWKRDFFSIQCGAFSHGKSAQDAVARLRAQGIDAAVEPGSGSASYIVLAGRYRTYEQAAIALAAVRRAQPDAFVVP